MPSIRTGYACPTCQRQTGDLNEVLADSGKLRCSKVVEHTWLGSDEFADMKPVMAFKQEQAKPQAQQGHVALTVQVPLRVKNAVQARFAEKSDATVAGLLSMMAEGECMVIGETDLQRIASVMPERPKSGSHLFGMITALIYERDEAKQIADATTKDVKAYEGMSVGRVLVDLGEQYSVASDRARSEELPVRLACQKWLKDGLANNWF